MILVDTNVLARSLQLGSKHYQPAIDAIAHERTQNNKVLIIAPQTLIELYVTCTRTENGLGLTPEQALLEIADVKTRYPLLPETSAIFPQWEGLVAKYKPTNRRVFDTRHVAFMLVHQIRKLLSFNDKDFMQCSEIQVLNPFDVLNIPRA